MKLNFYLKKIIRITVFSKQIFPLDWMIHWETGINFRLMMAKIFFNLFELWFTTKLQNKNRTDTLNKNCTILHGNLLRNFFEFNDARACTESRGFSAQIATLIFIIIDGKTKASLTIQTNLLTKFAANLCLSNNF